MFLCTIIIPVSPLRSDGWKTKHKTKRFLRLECDQCKISFEMAYRTRFRYQELHFCCAACAHISRSVGGKIRKKVEATCNERIGAKSPFEAEISKAKSKQTWIENYGVSHPMKSNIVLDKIKQTVLNLYGYDNVLKSPIIREQIVKTCIAKYGTGSPMQNDNIKKCSRQTRILNSPNTLSSKSEDKFYLVLCEHFGSNDVERQSTVRNWSIDFYIKSIDTYVQFDGVYWHGVGKIFDDLFENLGSQEKGIFSTIIKDNNQNSWFKENCKRLVRITDKQFFKKDFNLLEALK